jgi:hypothetical protein
MHEFYQLHAWIFRCQKMNGIFIWKTFIFQHLSKWKSCTSFSILFTVHNRIQQENIVHQFRIKYRQ